MTHGEMRKLKKQLEYRYAKKYGGLCYQLQENT